MRTAFLPRILFFSVLLLIPGALRAAEYFDVAGMEAGQSINAFARVLLDQDDLAPEQLESLIESKGLPVANLLSGGYRDGYYWARLNLTNSGAETRRVNLVTANRLIWHFEYFAADTSSIRRLRDTVPTLEISLRPRQNLHLLLKMKFGLQDHVNFRVEPPTVVESSVNPSFNLRDILFGVILSMLAFNICLFLLTGDRVFVLHSLSALLTFICVFLLNGLSYYYFGTDRWNHFLPVAGNFAVAANNAFGQAYLNTREGHPRIHRYFSIGTATGVIGGLLLLSGVSKRIIYATDLNMLALALMGFATVYLFPPNRYRVMRFYVLGWLGLACAALVWLASEYGIMKRSFFTDNVMNFGLSFELMIVSLGLADQINHYKNRLSEYNRNLEQTVSEKTRDIRSIMEYIPMGVFMIQSDDRIHRDHSRRMQDIFPQVDLTHKAATEILFEPFQFSGDERSQAVSSIQTALGEHSINFETNAHMLPLELRDAHQRIWDLTWNAMENDQGRVDKILVTMREVTEIRKLLERSLEQQAELELIGEIIAIPPQHFQRFIRSTRDMFLESGYVLSQANSRDRASVLKILFINAHTVKGVARTLYLKRMTEHVHQMEQVYAEQRWDPGRMQKDLETALHLLDRYEGIAREKLGRNLEQSRSIEFPLDLAERGYAVLQQVLRDRVLTAEASAGMERLRDFLQQRVFRTAHAVFTEICDGLPALARDLKKEPPELELNVAGFHIKDQAEDILRNIFVHVLRNSMDHGIETADERLMKGKPGSGRIRVSMVLRGTEVVVLVEDDGRGLDLRKIRSIAQEKQLIVDPEGADPVRIANLIFDASLSTARELTEISGRGIGMNAVKRFAKQHEGDVFVKLESELPDGFHRIQFQIVLPAVLFEVDQAEILQKLA